MEDYKKKYKEVLKRIKECVPDDNGFITIYPQEIFPELRKSEDEKIKKEITEFFKKASGGFLDTTIHCKTFGKWLAWIEKQGEQKPKFRVGDTIKNKITNEIFTISNRCLSLGYYHNENHSLEVKFSEQDDWELVEQKPVDKVALSTFKDKLLELFQKFRWYCKGETPTNGDIIEYVDAHIQELIDTIQKPDDEIKPKFNVGDTIAEKNNSDIHDFGSFIITDITGGKYWYNDRIICDISEQDKWKIYEPVRQKPVEWEPQTGDTFRKKGTTSPTYHLCDKLEDGITLRFCGKS